MPTYPAQIDNSASLPTVVDNFTPVRAAVFNPLRDAVVAIESALGVNPNGLYSTVAGRLGALENVVGNLQIIEIQQDIGGTLESPLIVGIQGRPISDAAPLAGQALVWNGIAWLPGAAGGSTTFGGDIAGISGFQTVTGIQGTPISVTTPTTGQVLEFNGTHWAPAVPPSGFTAGHDLSGTPTSQTVIGIRGNIVPSPTGTNTVLEWTGSALTWGSGAGFTAGGDLSGTSTVQKVVGVDGYAITAPFPAGLGNETLVGFEANFGEVSCFYYDSVTGYLWMGAWNNTTVTVLDTATESVVASIVTGNAANFLRRIVGDTNFVYTTSPLSTNRNIQIISKTTFATVGLLTIHTGGANIYTRDLAVDNAGNLWATDNNAGTVSKFTPSDIASAITNFPTPQTPSGGTLTFPTASSVESCCFDIANDVIWVTSKNDSSESNNSTIYKVSTSATLLAQAGFTGSNFSYFHGVQAYQGFLWLGTDNTTVAQVDPTIFPGAGFCTLISTNSGKTGDVYIDTSTSTVLVQDQSNVSPVPKISRINAPAGTLASTIALPGPTHYYLTAIATSASQLWIGDRNALPGVYLFSNTVGSETGSLLIPQNFSFASPVMWESSGTLLNTSQQDAIRYFNVTGSGFTFTKQTDVNGNGVATLNLSGGGGSLTVENQSTSLGSGFTTLNFTGNGVTASGSPPTATITIPGFTAGGDLTGSNTSQTVVGVQAVSISSTPPTTGQVLTATSGTAANWQTPSGGSSLTIQQNAVSLPPEPRLNFVNAINASDNVSNTSTDIVIRLADNESGRRAFNRQRLRTSGWNGNQYPWATLISLLGITVGGNTNLTDGAPSYVGRSIVNFADVVYFSGGYLNNGGAIDYPGNTLFGIDTLTNNSYSPPGVPLYNYTSINLTPFNFAGMQMFTPSTVTLNQPSSPWVGQFNFIFASGGSIGGSNNTAWFELGYVNPNPILGASIPTTTITSGSNGVSVGTWATATANITGTFTITVFDTTGFPGSGQLAVQTYASGTQIVSYTGTSGGTQFTGCTSTGSGFIPGGAQITPSPLVINVNSTTGFASSGTLQVVTNYGIQLINYSGTSGGNQFTGCTVSNALSFETMATGNSVWQSNYTRVYRTLNTGSTIPGPVAFLTNLGFTKARTTVTTGGTLPLATISVSNTNGFPFTGSFWVTPGGGTPQLITYTGKSGTSFTGCSGGSGTIASGNPVSADTPPWFAYIDGNHAIWFASPDGQAYQVSSGGQHYQIHVDDNNNLWSVNNTTGTTFVLQKFPIVYNPALAFGASPLQLGAVAASRTLSNSDFEGYTSSSGSFGIGDPYRGGLISDGKYLWGLAGSADTTGNQSWIFAYDLQTAALVKSFGLGYDTMAAADPGTYGTRRFAYDGETIWLSCGSMYPSSGENNGIKLINVHPETGEILFSSGILSSTTTSTFAGTARDMFVADSGDVWFAYTTANAGGDEALALYKASANAASGHMHSAYFDRLPGGPGGLQTGSVTLSGGTANVGGSGGTITITANSKIFLTMTTAGVISGGVRYQASSLVVGGPGVGQFTASAINTGGTVQSDSSTLFYLIVG